MYYKRYFPIYLIFSLSLLVVSCEKRPFDPRSKYIGEWEFEMTIYNYATQEEQTYTETGVIEYADDNEYMDWPMWVNGWRLGTNRKGALYQPPRNARHPDPEKVGEISRKKLHCDFNTSDNGPGLQVTMSGRKL